MKPPRAISFANDKDIRVHARFVMQSSAKEGIQVTHFISKQHARIFAVRSHFLHQRQRGPTFLGTADSCLVTHGHISQV